MTLRPCLECGVPSEASRCPEHTRMRHRDRTSARQRGYDGRHDRLSKRARKLQPWCTDCLPTEALTLHHTEEAWRRKAEGKSIRLRDVRVLCSPCNVDAGSSRPDDQGKGPIDGRAGPPGEAKSAIETWDVR